MDWLIFAAVYLFWLCFVIWSKYTESGLDVWEDILDRSYQYRHSVFENDKISEDEKIRLISIESAAYDAWVEKIWNVRKF